jgi:two-component system chemotaxis response regulator CheB
MKADSKGEAFVYPGQLYAGKAPISIKTILGSCVAVILMDRKAGVLGLCHYLLDRPPGGNHSGYRYGVHAIPALIQEMQLLGASPQRLEAQIFGGANLSERLLVFHQEIGKSNILIAQEILRQHGIPLTRAETGGHVGRNIRVSTDDFDVFSRELTDGYGSSPISKTGIDAPRLPLSASVLIVDDSQTARALIERALSRTPHIKIAGTASDAYEARDKIVQLKPEVLLLDIEMPRLNGVDFLEKVMLHHPLPVIMVSSLNPDGKAAQRALELGAIEFVQKPSQYDPNLLLDLSATLPQKILAAAATRYSLRRAPPTVKSARSSSKKISGSSVDIICVAGNVGCVSSLESLLIGLEDDSPPVILAISTISTIPQAFINNVKERTKLSINLIENPQIMSRGKVYFTNALHHGVVEPGPGGSLQIKPVAGSPVQGQRPSGDVLMISASKIRPGSTCGVLLGGFGKDGIRGLLAINEAGGMTLVEDPASAAFPHNLHSALEDGLAEKAMPAAEMAAAIFERRSGTGS